MSALPTPSSPQHVQRQIVLPLSKAVEIAYKSIRLRLSRSLLVTSGIVLALAFLMSILASQAILDGMRGWSGRLDAERTNLGTSLTAAETEIREKVKAADPSLSGAVPAERTPSFAENLYQAQKEFGGLPAPPERLELIAEYGDRSVVPVVNRWLTDHRDFVRRRAEFNDAQNLDQVLAAKGVPVTAADIASDRTQTRWLLGLALMVAFVGILNAMLMSVTERFREIGTMKCLGALDSFIIKLFLIESLFQGVVGTVIGVAAGLALSLAGAVSSYGGYATKNIPAGTIAVGVLTCLVVGVGLTVAGAVYPAWQAARMQPIEAMRSEA